MFPPIFARIIYTAPWYAIPLVLLGAAALTAWLYYKNPRTAESPRLIIYVLTALRFLAISGIGLLLLGLLLKYTRTETEEPMVIFSIDNSRSMVAGNDSAYIRRQLPGDLNNLRARIAERFTVKTVLFSGEAHTGEDPDFSGKETDIDQMFRSVENNYANQNVGALVLVSDGIYNRGGNPAQNISELPFPVFAIATGDTAEKTDVAIRRLDYNQVVYQGNDFPLEVLVAAKKAAGEQLRVQVVQAGKTIATQTIRANSANFTGTLRFALPAGTPGIQRYSVTVVPVKAEMNVANNTTRFAIDVIDTRQKVLLLAHAPHPDVAALREVLLKSGAYETEYHPLNNFNGVLKPFSLVIIHGAGAEHQSIIENCRNTGVPYWIVNPRSSNVVPGVRVVSPPGRFNDCEPVTNPSFGLFGLSSALTDFITALPAVKCFFGNYEIANGTQILIKQRIGAVETDNPILFFSEQGGVKSGAFLADGLWRWKLRDYAEHENHQLFEELVSKCVQYLSVKADKSFFRVTAPRLVSENESIEMQAEVYNQSYELVTTPDVPLVLTNQDGKRFRYNFSKTARDYRLNLGALPPGDYKYEATCSLNGQDHRATGAFSVQELIAERINTVANHRLLYQLAEGTGGRFFTRETAHSVVDSLLKNEQVKPITYTTLVTRPIIELWWLLAAIGILLSAEWFIRKRYFTI